MLDWSRAYIEDPFAIYAWSAFVWVMAVRVLSKDDDTDLEELMSVGVIMDSTFPVQPRVKKKPSADPTVPSALKDSGAATSSLGSPQMGKRKLARPLVSKF